MIDNDDIFDALADSQRRQLLVGLLDRKSKHVPNLSGDSREMAGANETLLQAYLTSDREFAGVDRDLVRMHCVHLPELAESGFVEWDGDANVVTRGPRFDELKPLLELLDDHREGRLAPESVPLLRQ